MPNGAGSGGGTILGVSNSFTGVAQGLEIVGTHGYCLTGNHGATSTPVEAMKFTTGNYYLVGILQVNMALNNAGSGFSVSKTYAQVEFNGSIVSHLVANQDPNDQPTSNQQPLIIPAFTQVVVKLYSDENEAARYMTASLTGEIHR